MNYGQQQRLKEGDEDFEATVDDALNEAIRLPQQQLEELSDEDLALLHGIHDVYEEVKGG